MGPGGVSWPMGEVGESVGVKVVYPGVRRVREEGH